ncbi:MAG: molybdopterin molybdotransferase MoeA [Bacteroidia bacterium]|nr:molybdopterin molybdotransferase MoeA [Bacteroidia bacterium]
MITLKNAQDIILNSAQKPYTENIDFAKSLNRVLAEDVFSDADYPSFDKSAVDGYACRMQDIHDILVVIETLPAGKNPRHIIGKGQCSKIMTGAMIPDGADCVIMVEDTEINGDNKIRFTGNKTAKNIRYKGEEIRKNDILLKKGTLIRPQEIAVMAMMGCVNPLVSGLVKVGVISTGDELVEPYEIPAPSQIRNSNAWQLLAQVGETGLVPVYFGIACDLENIIIEKINNAIDNSDVIILSGGVSMGDFDLVPAVLEKAGFNIVFRSISVQPGRPTLFGVKEGKYVFGLPGNPVSSFVIFELLVKPFLYKLMGYDYSPPELRLPLSEGFERKNADREKWIPVKIMPDRTVSIINYRGSAHIHALTQAGGLASIPLGVYELNAGDLVYVRPL